ncbi:MAG TPA: SRPBCC domain-containing protein [Acidimicrobiales bacterium]
MTDSDPDLGELTYFRIWDAPRELVFDCMTTPEHLSHFWGPAGVSTPLGPITIELRTDGAFETIVVNDADGAEYPMRGVYVEVVSPDRLAWTEAGVEGG